MSVRTQITLSDQQYSTLKRESDRTGASLAELVRQALDAHYGRPARERLRALDRSFATWPSDIDPAGYVAEIRAGDAERTAETWR